MLLLFLLLWATFHTTCKGSCNSNAGGGIGNAEDHDGGRRKEKNIFGSMEIMMMMMMMMMTNMTEFN